jgi:hypothetical protein
MWPFGVVLWGRASNRRMPHWPKTVVVSDTEKAPGRGCQVGIRETVRSPGRCLGSLLTCRYLSQVTSKPVVLVRSG